MALCIGLLETQQSSQALVVHGAEKVYYYHAAGRNARKILYINS